jgi:hypothetical protein
LSAPSLTLPLPLPLLQGTCPSGQTTCMGGRIGG